MHGPETEMDLSIVIVTWNRKLLLSRCLRSVLSHTRGLTYETIVLDNGSTDGTLEMIREDFPGIRLISNRENLGFTKGNNRAIREAGGRYIALLNNDTLLLENALETLVSFMDSHPKAGAVGPLLLNPDGSIQESALGAFINIRIALVGGEHLSRWTGRLLPGRPSFVPEMVIPAGEQKTPREVAWVVGACMVIRRDAWRDAGPFDEAIFMYMEDMEWCYRAHRSGWSVYFCPHARVVHLDHLPTKAAMGSVVGQQLAHQIYFIRKHRGRLSALCLGFALFLGTFIKLPGFALAWCFCRLSGRPVGKNLIFKLKYYLHAQRYFLLLPFGSAGRWVRRAVRGNGDPG